VCCYFDNNEHRLYTYGNEGADSVRYWSIGKQEIKFTTEVNYSKLHDPNYKSPVEETKWLINGKPIQNASLKVNSGFEWIDIKNDTTINLTDWQNAEVKALLIERQRIEEKLNFLYYAILDSKGIKPQQDLIEFPVYKDGELEIKLKPKK
jgi:hypothetical protein